MTTHELRIERLGHEGEGIATTAADVRSAGGPAAARETIFVPFTTPGDIVTATIENGRGRIVGIVAPGPDRVAPVCRHFGTCGGCAVQHIGADAYVAWKTGIVAGALAQHGIAALVQPLVTAPPASRRRAVFGASRGAHGVILGFHEPRGHRLFDMAECPVLSGEIVTRLPWLRMLADVLLPRFPARRTGARTGGGDGVRIVVTMCEERVDVVVEGAGAVASASAETREAIAAVARDGRFTRVSLDRDPVYALADPTIRFGSAQVAIPPGVFLQAVPEIERAMAADIVEAVSAKRPGAKPAVKPAKRVADLYCGLGTFTFPLAASAEVLAVDSDNRALAALDAARRRTPGLKPVTTLARDLFRDPLSARELDAFDAIVFDPPRAGAAAQAERIAKSKVPTVVAVSCAPGTLARDLAVLIGGGYRVERVTAYDQFVYTSHVEVVAVLRR